MTHTNHYRRLLVGLVIYLATGPIIQNYFSRAANLLVEISAVAFLVVSVRTITGSRRWYGTALALVAVGVLASAGHAALGIKAVHLVSLLAMTLFCGLLAALSLNDVLFGGPADENRLVGAVCIYLLIGVIWSMLFLMLDLVTAQPVLNNLTYSPEAPNVDAFVYFSFVTLTTLGYGDVSPLTPVARVLAYMEAAFGQLYLTILVASLVGMLLNRSRPATDE